MSSDKPLFTVPKPSEVLIPNVRKGTLDSDMIAKWNTADLGLRLGADATSAASASAMVAPVICIIDKAIVQKASTGAHLSSSLYSSLQTAVLQPHRFLTSKPFLLIFSLYFTTYATANSIDTFTSTVQSKPAPIVTSSTTKFLATSAVNMSMCIYKDSQFARMFGNPAANPAAATIPKLSYMLFAARDSMTIFASFNLPPLLSERLKTVPEPVRQKFSRFLSTDSGRLNTAQFIAPAAMQIFSTPIHLLGLDLYNRQQRLGVGERFGRVCRDWGVSALARMGRIVPAFGVGGVVNAGLRRKQMTAIEA